MPRPLPDNVETITGWSWYLIPVPDHPVFVQAAWDAYSELAHPWNWGKEGRVPDSDIAAQLWANALYEALRVRDMGFPDSILDYIDEVEALLQQILQTSGCCSNVAPTDETQTFTGDYPTTAPSTWGDGETVVDSDDWQELVCGAANAYVDYLKEMNDNIQLVIAGGSLVIGAIAGLLGLLTGAGVLAAVAWGTASTVVGNLVALGSGAAFAGVDDDIEAAREDIVCAIWNDASATALADAVEAAVGSVAWSTFYAYVDYPTALATMLTGTLGDQHLPVNRDDTCYCAPDTLGSWDWGSADNGWDGWTNDAGASLETTYAYRFLWGLIMYRTFTLEAGTTQVTISMHAAGPAGIPQRVRVQARDGASVSGTILATVDHDFESNETFDYVLNVSGRTGASITINVYKDSGSQSYRPQLFDATSTYS